MKYLKPFKIFENNKPGPAPDPDDEKLTQWIMKGGTQESFIISSIRSALKSGDATKIDEAFTKAKQQQIEKLRLVNLRLPSFYGGRGITPQEMWSRICNLTSLKELDLHYNKLEEVPGSIGKLTNLEKLNLKSNKLTSLPESIDNLTSLKELNLSSNELSDDEKRKVKELLPNTEIIF